MNAIDLCLDDFTAGKTGEKLMHKQQTRRADGSRFCLKTKWTSRLAKESVKH